MGKAKRARTKLHTPAVRNDTSDNNTSLATSTPPTSKTDYSKLSPLSQAKLPDNVFSGLKINLNALKTLDVGSAEPKKPASTSSTAKNAVKKKDKRKQRHLEWNKKVSAAYTARKEVAAKRKREKIAVVGDMQPLQDTLPTLDLLLQTNNTNNKEKTTTKNSQKKGKKKAIKKESQQKKDMLADISLFQQVRVHPAFKAKPLDTISEHLKNKLIEEEEEMDQ